MSVPSRQQLVMPPVCWPSGKKTSYPFACSAAAKLVTGFTTVYAVLLALGANPGGSAGAGAAVDVCELSATQVSMVQSVLQKRNASCSFNMTIDEILGM